MSRKNRNVALFEFMWYSFLDLICCSFGAALLMFLMISSVEEKRFIHENKVFIVRAMHQQGSKAEVGIEFKRPGMDMWKRPEENSHNVYSFSMLSQPASGSEAFVMLFEPAAGTWHFRTFLVNYPNLYFGDDFTEKPDTTCQLQMQILGQETLGDCKVFKEPGKFSLSVPGDTSPELVLHVPLPKGK